MGKKMSSEQYNMASNKDKKGFQRGTKIRMIYRCLKRNDYWTNIGSPDFDRDRKQRGYLETPEQGLSSLNALKKNGMWQMRDSSPKLLRQDCTKNTVLVMCRHACIPGGGGPARTMSELQESENRGVGLDSEEPLWQRLKPYEKFAEMIERHWDGIAAYSRPENKVSLGFVEGLNNKIRVIQRMAYGLRDEEYMRLKILTCMLKEI